MSFTNPIIEAGLSGLTDLFADRAVTPVEVFQSYQSRIDGLDGALGCYVALDRAGAEQAAHESAERWARGAALSLIEDMCSRFLTNPVIEDATATVTAASLAG